MAIEHSKLTPKRAQAVLNAIVRGGGDNAACQVAGISRGTLYNWLQRGAAGERGFTEFARAYEDTKGARILALTEKIAQSTDWRAAAHLLACYDPEEFSEKHRHELTGKDGGPLRHEVAGVTMEELVTNEHGRALLLDYAASSTDASGEPTVAIPDGDGDAADDGGAAD